MGASRPGARLAALFATVLAAALAVPAPASAQLRGSLSDEDGAPPSEAGYRVKPVDGAPTAPGVRRLIETFSAWTLICDEARGRRVCNAAQSIVAADGGLAFSWSLAATRGGEPVFLVRAPVAAYPARTVSLDFGARETMLRLPTCDARLCVGFLPLDPEIVRRIKARGSVAIRYRAREGGPSVQLTASLDGLGAALGSLR